MSFGRNIAQSGRMINNTPHENILISADGRTEPDFIRGTSKWCWLNLQISRWWCSTAFAHPVACYPIINQHNFDRHGVVPLGVDSQLIDTSSTQQQLFKYQMC